MFGNGHAAPTLPIPGTNLPRAHSANITENLCAISLCCVEDRSRLPLLTFAPVIETSSPQPRAGNSPAFVWLRMEELRGLLPSLLDDVLTPSIQLPPKESLGVARAAIDGLSAKQKSLPAWLFYDTAGSLSF